MEAETNCLDSAMSFTENEAVRTIEQEAVGTIEQEELCPLGDRIMVQVVVPKEVITNGIYHPENTIERPLEGMTKAFESPWMSRPAIEFASENTPVMKSSPMA